MELFFESDVKEEDGGTQIDIEETYETIDEHPPPKVITIAVLLGVP